MHVVIDIGRVGCRSCILARLCHAEACTKPVACVWYKRDTEYTVVCTCSIVAVWPDRRCRIVTLTCKLVLIPQQVKFKSTETGDVSLVLDITVSDYTV